MAGLFEELRRRNVFKVGAAYVVLAWLMAQAADLAAETFAAPDWVMKMLVTLLALAFPLVLFFAWAYELTPEGIKKEKDVDRSQSITRQTGRKLDFAVIAILVLALGYFIWESRFEERASPRADAVSDGAQSAAATGDAATTDEPVATVSPKSIAVLPFVNMSDDASNEYFSDGISEEILNALAKVRDLKVAGRTSSFAFKGQNQDLRSIGETLGVANILEGSVRKSGDKVRITAQLIQVDDGFHLWSESYDRELDDVFAIQDEISAAILTELKAQLLDDAQPRVVAERTNSDAYDMYLLARQRIYDRSTMSIQSAADLLDQAIRIDPEYAPAYAQRGIAALLLSTKTYGTKSLEDSQAEARYFLDQALELDPDSAEALAGMGFYYGNMPGEYQKAIEYLERSLAINPSLIDASNWLQNTYLDMGESNKSFEILREMNERDPLYKPALGNLINAYNARGMTDRAQATLDRAQSFLPGDPMFVRNEAVIKSISGDLAAALPIIETAVRHQPDNRTFRFTLSLILLETQQNERLIAEGIPEFITVGLHKLGRDEEAIITAQEVVAEGNIYPLLNLLNHQRKHADLVDYVESRWPDLDRFETDFPSGDMSGAFEMIELAYAYAQTGNQARFEDAMGRIRRAHDQQLEWGANNRIFFMSDASYYAMEGDYECAIRNFERAVELGQLTEPKVSRDWIFLETLEGDPDFELVRQRMIENLNRERTAMGLQPVET